jgi:hypothetical protein
MFEEPIGPSTDGISPIRMATFGPPPPGMPDGLWISLWTDVMAGYKTKVARGIPASKPVLGTTLDQEINLPFAPLTSIHLLRGYPITHTPYARMLRTVCLALIGLSHNSLPWHGHRPVREAAYTLARLGYADTSIRIVDVKDAASLLRKLLRLAAVQCAETESRYGAIREALPDEVPAGWAPSE